MSGGIGRWRALIAVLALSGSAAAPAAALTPTVTEFTGGVTPGFSANAMPQGITSGPDGNLWIAEDGPPGRVARITPGGVVTEFTNGVTADGQPWDIVAGPDGNLWMTESGAPGHLARVTTSGAVTELTGGITPGFSANAQPTDIVTGSNGNLWFTERDSPGRFAQILPNGGVNEHTGGVTPGFSANATPFGLAAGPDGNLWVTEYSNPGRVARIATSAGVSEFTGGVTPGFTANAGPNEISAGPDGNLWFTEYNAPGGIGRITPGGAVTQFTGGVTPGFSPGLFPEQIVAGPDGAMWFTDYDNVGHVARITTGGAVTEFTAGSTPGFSIGGLPEGITVGPDGNIWFTEAANPGRVARLTTPPVAVTGDATALGATSARLAGVVNGHAQPTSVHFELRRVGQGQTVTTAAQDIGSSAADDGVSASVSDLSPGASYAYRVVATNPTDTTSGSLRTFTMTAAGAAMASITRLRVAPRSLLAAKKGRSIRAAAATGATVSYTDSQPARTTFTVLRRKVGVRRAGACVAPRPRQRIAKAKRCVRYVAVGSFAHTDRAGINRLHFTGRIRGHKLAPGAYRLTAKPRFHGLVGRTATTSFTVRHAP